MWVLFEHECSSGSWKKRDAAESADKAALALHEAKKSNSDSFVFWDGPLPAEASAQQLIFERAFDLNQGRLLRVILGAEVKKMAGHPLASCSGNCFCVVAGGARRCETQYCNENGYCWWVDCGSSC